MTDEQKKFLEPILNTFENEDIKMFAEELINNFPPYIWAVGASSTQKYHPAYTLGKTGLMKHQVAVCRFINFFFELEQYSNRYDSRKRDLLRVAALTHDGRKSGSQEDYEKSKYTKFDHPLLIAKEILSYKDKGFLSEEELKYIAKAQISHMGQYNTDKRSSIILPTPKDEAQELLHLADYLASRKCLNMSFDDYDIPQEETSDIETYYTMPFGKHKGTLLKDIDKGYLRWLKDNTELREPLKTFIPQLLED